MANFYAQLKQTIRDFNVLFIEPPSYLKHFISDDDTTNERIVFFCNTVCTFLSQISIFEFRINLLML